jgi:hypothetical protein
VESLDHGLPTQNLSISTLKESTIASDKRLIPKGDSISLPSDWRCRTMMMDLQQSLLRRGLRHHEAQTDVNLHCHLVNGGQSKLGMPSR